MSELLTENEMVEALSLGLESLMMSDGFTVIPGDVRGKIREQAAKTLRDYVREEQGSALELAADESAELYVDYGLTYEDREPVQTYLHDMAAKIRSGKVKP